MPRHSIKIVHYHFKKRRIDCQRMLKEEQSSKRENEKVELEKGERESEGRKAININ